VTLSRTNTVLAVLLVIVVIATSQSGVDYSKPNIEILPDMKYTPAWTAFESNPNFPDGRTMQAPVAGTIARDQMPLYFAATKEDAVRAGEELENPVGMDAIETIITAEQESAVEEPSKETEPSPQEQAVQDQAAQHEALVRDRFAASVERGGEVYRVFCISCHGPKGAGDGPVPQRGFPPPPSMLTGKSPQMKDGQLFHILTYGQGSMSSFAAQLARKQRWDVINYVRDLQKNAPPVPPTEAASVDAVTKPDESGITEPDPDTTKPPADAVEKKAIDKPETGEPNTPPNQLRESETNAEKKTETPESPVPAANSEPNTDAKS
jgi:mono/diheme cytochrome c family protein